MIQNRYRVPLFILFFHLGGFLRCRTEARTFGTTGRHAPALIIQMFLFFWDAPLSGPSVAGRHKSTIYYVLEIAENEST